MGRIKQQPPSISACNDDRRFNENVSQNTSSSGSVTSPFSRLVAHCVGWAKCPLTSFQIAIEDKISLCSRCLFCIVALSSVIRSFKGATTDAGKIELCGGLSVLQ